MFGHYLRTAWNNIAGNRLYSAINLFGLSVGLAACLLITLYVISELRYDSQWTDAGAIYRVNHLVDNNGNGVVNKYAFQPVQAGPVLERYFDEEVAQATRIYNLDYEIQHGEDVLAQRVARVDPELTAIFDLETVAGDLDSTFDNASRVALSEQVAARIFGAEDPVGQVLTLIYRGRSQDYEVSAVYRMPEGNSVIELPAFVLLDPSVLPEYLRTSWILTGPETYLKLAPGVSAEAVGARLPAFIDQYVDLSNFELPPGEAPSSRMSYELQNIRDIYLNSAWDTFHDNTGNRTAVYAFAATAVLLLLIACVNFIILTTVRASTRMREIGMRKTLGAGRGQLFVQFIGETWLYVLLSLAAALGLAELLLPAFNAFTGKALAIDFGNPLVYLVAFALAALVSLVGGFYPAILLPAYSPARVLKPDTLSTGARLPLASSLMVVFQFSISIALLVATAVIHAQIQYSLNRDIGFDKDNLLVLRIDDRRTDRAAVLRERLLREPGITHAALSYGRPPQSTVGYYGVSYYLPDTDRARMEIRTSDVGEDFFETYRIDIVAGRSYSPDRDLTFLDDYSEEEGEFIDRTLVVNESAVRLFGFDSPEDALGRIVFLPNLGTDEREMRFTIVGVSRDTRFFSLNAPPQPWLFHFAPAYTRFLNLRYEGVAEAEVLETARRAWTEVMGDTVFNAGFVDEFLVEELRQERLEATVLTAFSLLTIFVACLGLFGLASFTVERRTKEIGIRKALGASVRQVVQLLLWQLSRPVLLANVIAWPTVSWLMIRWLQRFPDQIALWLLLPFCIGAGLTVLAIAWLTVGGTAAQAASRKPVLALRYE